VKNELKIGWLILLAVVIVFGFMSWLKRKSLTVSYENREVLFYDISGLRKGDPVTVFGREAGYVSGFRQPGLDTTGWIVWIRLDPEIKLNPNVRAILKLREITGGRVIDLIPLQQNGAYIDRLIRGETAWDAGMALKEIQPAIKLLTDSSLLYILKNTETISQALASGAWESRMQNIDNTLVLTQSVLSQMHILLSERKPEVSIPLLVLDIRNSFVQIDETLKTIKPFLNQDRLVAFDSMLLTINATLAEAQILMNQSQSIIENLKSEQGSLVNVLLKDTSLPLKIDSSLLELHALLKHIREGRLKARIRF